MSSVDEIQSVPFGSFLLLERLAMGGMAEVFLARDTRDDRLCAIKRILPTVAADDEFIAMFIDEAKIAGQLNHQNIARIIEIGKIDGSYFIAMEYVSGHDARALWDRVRDDPPADGGRGLPIGLTSYIVRKLSEGLDYAHKRRDARGRPLGIIHRDISPQNVLISYDGDLKIIDFGIAKAADRLVKTQTGILKGKFAYMAPEQARGEPIDHRSDVFAIGVVLYELLTGERAFKADTDFGLLEKVRRVDVVPVRQLRPEVPRDLERIVMKALARDAGDRYAWAGLLADELDRFLGEQGMTATRDELGAFVRRTFRDEHAEEQERLRRLTKGAPDGVPATIDPFARSTGSQASPVARSSRNGRSASAEDETALGVVDPSSAEDLLDDDTAVIPPSPGDADSPGPAPARDVLRDEARPAERAGRAPADRTDRADRGERADVPRTGRTARVSAEGRAIELRGEAAQREPGSRPTRSSPLPAAIPTTASDVRETATATAASGGSTRTHTAPSLADAPRARSRPAPTASEAFLPPPLVPTQAPQPALPSTPGANGVAFGAALVGALVGAGLAFAVALAVRTPAPDTLIVTEPRQTEVRRGETVLCGQTPCAVRLGKGTHTLRLAPPGVAPVDRVVDVSVGAALVDVVLDQPGRRIGIETNPQGATVEVDGAVVDGITPLTLPPQVAGRSIRLRIARDGFEPLFVEREVVQDATWRFDLPTSTTTWTLTTVPADALIVGAGREAVGTTTFNVGRRPVTLKLLRPGCEPASTTLSANGSAAAERQVELSCRAFEGFIAIDAPRRPVAVRIDGVNVGKAAPLDRYPLPVGSWEVSIVTPRGRRDARVVDVRAGETARFTSTAK